jgi:DNA-directed RNA polymerase subunit RPC12/RpoP/tetratricopeptide (TPR) repeat protein
MIGIKCAACGNSFEVPDDQSGKNARCPNCGATVFVPTVASSAQETPASQAPTEKIEKPKHFLSPLEMVLILVILGIMITFVVYKVAIVAEKPGPATPAENVRDVSEAIRENNIKAACFANMQRIAEALDKYCKEHNAFPDDLGVLKETGVLEVGVPLFCDKGRYTYYKREAVASKDIVKDPILVADSGAFHLGGRNVIRVPTEAEQLSVEYLKEKDFADIIAAQRKEYAKLDAAKDKAQREREERERKAGELMVEAAAAIQTGKHEEALHIYKDLLDEYADTKVVNKKADEIKSKIAAIIFSMEIANTRDLVQQLSLDEAKKAYARLGENATDEQKKTLEKELEYVKLIEEGRSLRTMGDLSGAIEKYKELGSTSAVPFWKRMAHALSEEIENYRKEAVALLETAQAALKAGKKVRALSLFMSLADNYPHSAQAPKAASVIAELVKEVPYRERFLPKVKLLDKNTATANKIANAIKDSLAWLALQQKDGVWKSTSTGKSALDEIALTGLATLCFMAEGNTHLFGQYRGVVAAAINKLKAAQKDNGLIGNPASTTYRMSHALALLALCELRNMTDDDTLTPVCQKAVNYAINIQEPGWGWRLADKKSDEDITLTTWMQLGMLSAEVGKLKFLKGLLKGAINTYNDASDLQGRVNYSEPVDPSRPQRHLPAYQSALTATAAAVYGKLASGDDPGATRVRGAIEFMRANLPNGTRTNFPYFFFGTYALYQGDERSFLEWKWALNAVLLPAQLQSGKDAGAWDMGKLSDFRGGKVYPTALAILALQAPYNRRSAHRQTRCRNRGNNHYRNCQRHYQGGDALPQGRYQENHTQVADTLAVSCPKQGLAE